MRNSVIVACEKQSTLFNGSKQIYCNAQISSKLIRELCEIDSSGKTLLKKAIEKSGLSARAYDRILQISRTIADLEGKKICRLTSLQKQFNIEA